MTPFFPSPVTTLTTYFFVVLLFVYYVLSRRYRNRLPYPPGPPSEPIIGHLRLMPSSDQEIAFREWSKLYGDILYLHIPGHSYLVLNSVNAAKDLLDKRSAIYSDRMRLVLYEMMGYCLALPFMTYGKRFQKHRKLLHDYLNQKQCKSYHPLQIHHSRRLLLNLVNDPNNWMKHTQNFSIGLIVKIAYGKDIVSEDDPYIDLINKILDSFIACGSPGKTPVDFFPILRYFPSWFPGTYYASKARSLRSSVDNMHSYPFEDVKRQMKDGVAPPSFLAHHLSRLHGEYQDETHIDDIRAGACTIFTGGAETTAAALLHFILEMVLFPKVQRKAQNEIDTVIGRSRLPELSDRGTLPYVEAMIKEVLRWNTVVPMGMPHRLMEDDIYNGMFIPKGTVVIANAYSILRDESIYSDPDSFNPDRYLPKPEGKAEPDPVGHFGFGRRICPGRYLAEDSLWISITSILATLDIRCTKDDHGNAIVPRVEMVSGLTSHPKPFPCTIKPRDDVAECLIRQAMPLLFAA